MGFLWKINLIRFKRLILKLMNFVVKNMTKPSLHFTAVLISVPAEPFFDKQIPRAAAASTHMQIEPVWVFSITCCDLHPGFVWGPSSLHRRLGKVTTGQTGNSYDGVSFTAPWVTWPVCNRQTQQRPPHTAPGHVTDKCLSLLWQVTNTSSFLF